MAPTRMGPLCHVSPAEDIVTFDQLLTSESETKPTGPQETFQYKVLVVVENALI